MPDADTEDGAVIPPMFNIVAGIVLAAVSIWLLLVTIPGHIGQAAGKNDISPSLFPTLAAWILLGLSLSLVAVHVAKLRNQGAGPGGQNGVWVLAQFAIWMVTAVLVYVGLNTIGFYVVAAALIGIAALACGYRNFILIGGLALAVPLICAQFAWSVFQVQLP